jgi:hypothetical protein
MKFFHRTGRGSGRSGPSQRIARYSAGLIDVFQEDPRVEATALVPLAGRFRYDILQLIP